ncbi:MAG: carbohydrate ABC transporter permease [Ilumatobacteraceae bacterium]
MSVPTSATLSAAFDARPVRSFLAVIGRTLFVALMLAFFSIPVLWLVFAPFDRSPGLGVGLPEFTLDNFVRLYRSSSALRALRNSIVLAGSTMLLVLVAGSLAAYALSRVRIPGRDLLLYVLLLLSSVVTGTAAMVPTFQLVSELHLVDRMLGVVLVIGAGTMPTVIFILKDFMDNIPKTYEESARLFGARPLRILWDVVVPTARPGLAAIAVWAVVQVWGNFLVPYILLRSPDNTPAAVVMYTFYTEGGQPNLRLISAFALVYSLPVILMYFVVSRRYGFRFYGGIKS